LLAVLRMQLRRVPTTIARLPPSGPDLEIAHRAERYQRLTGCPQNRRSKFSGSQYHRTTTHPRRLP
jgi:hypothetical protein